MFVKPRASGKSGNAKARAGGRLIDGQKGNAALAGGASEADDHATKLITSDNTSTAASKRALRAGRHIAPAHDDAPHDDWIDWPATADEGGKS